MEKEGATYHFMFMALSIDLTISLLLDFFPRDLLLDASRNSSIFPQGIQIFKSHAIDGDNSDFGMAESPWIIALTRAVFPISGAPEINMVE